MEKNVRKIIVAILAICAFLPTMAKANDIPNLEGVWQGSLSRIYPDGAMSYCTIQLEIKGQHGSLIQGILTYLPDVNDIDKSAVGLDVFLSGLIDGNNVRIVLEDSSVIEAKVAGRNSNILKGNGYTSYTSSSFTCIFKKSQ